MMGYKKDFQKSAEIHLDNVLKRKVRCGFFSLFYSEEKVSQRCLLKEYRDNLGKIILSIGEAKEICPFYNEEFKSKCTYKNNFPDERDRLIQILRETIIQLEKGD